MTKEKETEKVTLVLKEGEASAADVEDGRTDDENPDADKKYVKEKPEVDGNYSGQKVKGQGTKMKMTASKFWSIETQASQMEGGIC